MYCPHCGALITDSDSFCSSCGAAVNTQSGFTSTSLESIPQQPDDGLTPSNVLTFGIVGLALSGLGIPGIILSSKGKKKADAYIARHGQISKQVITGRILSRVGFPISIVMTVIWVIYIVGIIVLAFS